MCVRACVRARRTFVRGRGRVPVMCARAHVCVCVRVRVRVMRTLAANKGCPQSSSPATPKGATSVQRMRARARTRMHARSHAITHARTHERSRARFAAKYRDEDRAGADVGAGDDRAFLTSMMANVYRR